MTLIFKELIMQYELYAVLNNMQAQLCRNKQKGREKQSQGSLEGMYLTLLWND